MPVREVFLLLGLVGFTVVMCLIVFGSDQLCTATKSDHTSTESRQSDRRRQPVDAEAGPGKAKVAVEEGAWFLPGRRVIMS